jgi:hypothetical protein
MTSIAPAETTAPAAVMRETNVIAMRMAMNATAADIQSTITTMAITIMETRLQRHW